MDLVIRREKSCLKLSGWQQGSVWLWGHEGHTTAEPSGLSLGLWGGRPGTAPVLVEMPSVENRARGESGWWCGAPRELFRGFQGHGVGRMGSDPVLTRGSCRCRLCKSKSPKELLGKEHHAPSKPCSQSTACSSPSLSNPRARSGWAHGTPSFVPAAHSRAARLQLAHMAKFHLHGGPSSPATERRGVKSHHGQKS